MRLAFLRGASHLCEGSVMVFFVVVCLHFRFTDYKCALRLAVMRIISFTGEFVDRGVNLIFLRLV